jgi:hypothetical protein
MKDIIKEIIEVSNDLRHNIFMENTEKVQELQKQLTTLVEALKIIK